jgi:fumarate reductase subunit D
MLELLLPMIRPTLLLRFRLLLLISTVDTRSLCFVMIITFTKCTTTSMFMEVLLVVPMRLPALVSLSGLQICGLKLMFVF